VISTPQPSQKRARATIATLMISGCQARRISRSLFLTPHSGARWVFQVQVAFHSWVSLIPYRRILR